MQAVLDACASGRLDALPAVVISNNSSSGAMERARCAGIPAIHLSSATHADPEALDEVVARTLDEHGVQLVLLLGYMKKIGPRTLDLYRGRILNIHPALLPKHGGQGMYGKHVHQAVLEAGEKVTGVTIHLVDDRYDTGAIVAQSTVPVLAGDDVNTLAARVLDREHSLLVETLEGILSGGIHLANRL